MAMTSAEVLMSQGREQGRMETLRQTLLALGARRFGSPDAQVQSAIEAIPTAEQLERLTLRLLEVSSWEELLIGT